MYLPQRVEEVQKPGPDAIWLQVVGVVGAVKMKGLVEGEDSRVSTYLLAVPRQDAQRSIAFAIRRTGDSTRVTNAVRHALAALDPEVQLSDVFTMPDRVERSLTSRKTPMLLSVSFGLVALLLAALGIYGVLAYQVTQRTREIGIRMALGCDTRGVLGLVVREGAALVLVGLAVGTIGALALRQFIASQLYGVGALDPLVILSVTGVLALTAAAACLSPARRAARVNPAMALSQQ